MRDRERSSRPPHPAGPLSDPPPASSSAEAGSEPPDPADFGTASLVVERFSSATLNLRRSLAGPKMGEEDPLSPEARLHLNGAIVRVAQSIAFVCQVPGFRG
jgi:hypothetical protein